MQAQTQVEDIDLSKITFLDLFKTPVVNTNAKPSDKTRKQAEIKAICDEGIAIATEHEQFNTTYVLRTNEALYNMLSKIYAYALRINESSLKEQIIEAMRHGLKDKKVKTTSKTPWLTTVVKYVVNTDRQTAMNYSRVLSVAFDSDVAVADIPSFIERRGGIAKIHKTDEQIKADKERKEESADRLDSIRELLYLRALAEGLNVDFGNDTMQLPVKPTMEEVEQDAKYRGDFCCVITVYDYHTKTYKLGLPIEFSRVFEDSILRHIEARLALTTEGMRDFIKQYRETIDQARNVSKVLEDSGETE